MWWTGRAIGLDFETDGKDPTDARIITAGMVGVTPGCMPVEAEIMLQPERDIPVKATEVNGITTERATAEGMLREMGVATVVATIAEHADAECPLVGHNMPYDLTVLDREMRRTGVGRLAIEDNVFAQMGQVRLIVGTEIVSVFPVIDTYVLDKAVDRYRRGKRQLSFVAAHYGVPMAEGAAHGATADVIASLRIAIAIANQGYYSSLSLADLHLKQIDWAAEQARGLRQYFIENPGPDRDPAGVSEAWPLRTLTDGAGPVETIDTALI